MKKRARWTWIVVGLLVVFYTFQQFNGLSSITNLLNKMPLWTMIVFLGIVVSAWQYFKSARQEKDEDAHWLEEQGKVYMHRMEEEKKRRNQQQSNEEVHS